APWLRSTRPPPQGRSVKACLIAFLGERGLARLAREHGFAQNAHLLGVYGFDARPGRYATLLEHWLQSAATGDLLMCHPARPGSRDAIAAAREAEYEVLRRPAMQDLLARAEVSVVPLSTLSHR